MTSPLWAVTCLFNPQRYVRRIANFRAFRSALNVPLLAVELSFDGRFELGPDDANVLIQLRGRDVMWQKERLLNIGVRALPPECTSVALLDCDIVFERTDWATAAMDALKTRPALQPFRNVRFLERNAAADGPLSSTLSVQRSAATADDEHLDMRACLGPQRGEARGLFTPGMAWVYRRSLLDRHGLFEGCVIGGGDTAISAASWGVFEALEERHGMTAMQRRYYRRWAERWHAEVQGQVGVLDGDLRHLWHGELSNRRATGRHQIPARHQFDPALDIVTRDGEPLSWSSDKPRLHWEVKDYFAARQDDGPHTNGGVLIVRHGSFQANFYDCVVDWAREHFPEIERLLSVRDLPVHVEPDFAVKAVVMWLQDPFDYFAPDGYMAAEVLAQYYEDKGVRVINRASRTSRLSKSVAAPLIASAGFRVPKMSAIVDPAAFRRDFNGLSLPFFVRDNQFHQSPMHVAYTEDGARALPIESIRHPIAVELIDVASPRDGLYRKYRYFACGDLGVSQHLQVSDTYIVRGAQRVVTAQTIEEELAYISRQDPHHDRFQQAMKALQLDMAAFDYSYDRDGNVVVWEVNSFPHIQFAVSTTTHRNRSLHRSIAAMVAMYLKSAGMEIPSKLMNWVGY
ncbi:MAG: hypothetical protein ABI672_21155 [Vicinamibacteria bacterium]